ncbi:MAG: spoIIR [Clostridiales bacterium]|nr:spoIIR [Clostridiales bacterium]
MKKIRIFCLCLVILSSLILVKSGNSSAENVNLKLIRFHVVANSDSEGDQSVKLQIRDEILQKYGPIISESNSRNESLQLISENLKDIEDTANSILKKEGKSYSANAVLGDSIFPIKQYGTITLPAGEYTALKVVLGEGGGKNWWCVMFPPLCFIDVTRGLTSDETDEELRKVISSKDVESITAFKQETSKTEVVAKAQVSNTKGTSENKRANIAKKTNTMQPSIEFRLKSVEMFRRTFERLVSLF